jgi:hypothetical protein
VSHGFDGNGPGTISLAQDVGLISSGDVLTFDYRAGWDLATFSAPEDMDRLFEVSIETFGGGSTIDTFSILTAAIGTDTLSGANSDTGPLSASIDLSAYAGLDARISFQWTIPNDLSGPANAQLDNVAINPVPVPAAIWLFASGIIGLLGFSKRKRNV